MNTNVKHLIAYITLIIIGIYFLVIGLVKAKSFFIPLIIGVLLSMVMLPVHHRLRKWKIPEALSALISALLILVVCIGVFFMVSAQIQSIAQKWPTYKEKLKPKVEQVQEFVAQKTGISPQEQQKQMRHAISTQSKERSSFVMKLFPKFITFLSNFLLVFVYIFFFMFYRGKFKNAILYFIPEQKRDKGASILANFGKVSQQYLFGRFILILFLAVFYWVGLFIIDVKHAFLISIIAAILSLIPYIGNVIGVIIALFMSVLTNGSIGVIIGILVVFGIAQFIESYVLEPYVVGHQVELNPVVTILGVVVGGMIWGIAGMIIIIPVMGIFKVIFDNVEFLNPLGYLLDEQDTGGQGGWMKTIKNNILSKVEKKKSPK
ncbi:MAG: AI-2E family transporter [Bacteroidota bacterium]